MRSLRRGMNIVVASALLLAPALGWSGEVALQCSTAMRTVMQDLIPKFELASGHKVTVEYGVTLLMQKDIAAGKVFDVGVMLGGPYDELQRDGKFVPGTRVQLARFGQAVGMHAGGRKYDIGNVAGFRQMLLESGPIAISSGSSGVYFLALLQRLGLTEAVKPKLLSLRSADEVGEAITARRAELAILPISELLPIKDGAVLGPYPEELQEYMYSVGGISSTATHLGPARELLQFIADPAHRAVYSSKGLQPPN
jgi:molybdate transport system substrate-binding protein